MKINPQSSAQDIRGVQNAICQVNRVLMELLIFN